jgi:hypothetical protein
MTFLNKPTMSFTILALFAAFTPNTRQYLASIHGGTGALRSAAIFRAAQTVTRTAVLAVLIALIIGTNSYNSRVLAQSLDDGLRLTEANVSANARAGALGLAYHGIADDFAALNTNPAGLTLLPSTEFTVGLNVSSLRSRSTYFGTARDGATSSPLAFNIGLVVPVRSESSSFAFGIGYGRDSDFSQTDSLSGFNPSSSVIQSWVQSQNGPDLRNNRAFQLALADTVGNRLVTPLVGDLAQTALVQQRGGMNVISVGAAFDINDVLSVGGSLLISTGSYTYSRDYQEIDVNDRYNRLDAQNFTNVDFDRLFVNETIRQDITGLRGLIGIQGRFGSYLRAGVSLTTPGAYTIIEQYRFDGDARFEQGNVRRVTFSDEGAAEYTVSTPLVVSGGASFHVSEALGAGVLTGLTLSAGAEYTNGAQISMQSRERALQGRLTTINSITQRVLVPQVRWSVGAEYEIPQTPVVARVSVTALPSPYNSANAAVQSASTVIAGGAGVFLGVNSRIDATVRYAERSAVSLVDNTATAQTLASALQFAVQYSYRF